MSSDVLPASPSPLDPTSTGSDEHATSAAPGDRALLLGTTTDDGDDVGLVVLRQRTADATPELGVVRPMREGQPITGEVISLAPKPGAPRVCDVTVHLPAPSSSAGASSAQPRPTGRGPAQVASTGYRDGWSRTFGAGGANATSALRKRRDDALN